MSQLKNQRLLEDQRDILNDLPDGLIIFQQNKNLSYVNKIHTEKIDIKYFN